MRPSRNNNGQANGGGATQLSGGVVVPLMNRTHYDFSYLPVSPATETVNLVKALDVRFVTSAVLVVRIHTNEIGTNANMKIFCYPTAPSSEDPAEFTDGTEDIVATISSQTAPFYLDTVLSAPPKGAWWKVDLVAAQASSLVTISAQLSAFLVLRNG